MAYKYFKYRIYPNKTQDELIQKTFGCVRLVYNHFLQERIDSYKENGETKSFFQQNKSLTDLKKEYPWLQEPDKNALQSALRDLNMAYNNFLRSVKCGRHYGFPKFKSKKNSKKTYSTVAYGNLIRVVGTYIVLPKLHKVKAKISRDIPKDYRIVSAVISQEPSGKYYVSVLTEYEQEQKCVPINNALGLDYSSPHFYVDSNGNKADMPHFYREACIKLAREQRKLSKMVKGSNNYRKQMIRVAKIYEKMRHCRKDWQHKKSTEIANKYDLVVVEDINFRDMRMTLNFGKATNDNGFGLFRKMLFCKLEERGKRLITIDKWFPSTKTCRFCGNVNHGIALGQSEWDCPCCGAHLLRDHNAAINIKNEGLRLLA